MIAAGPDWGRDNWIKPYEVGWIDLVGVFFNLLGNTLIRVMAVKRVVNDVAGLLRGGADGLAGRFRPFDERMAGIAGAGANIAIAQRLTGSVEIRLRAMGWCIATS